MRPVTSPDEAEDAGGAVPGRSTGPDDGSSITAPSPAGPGSSPGTTWVMRVTEISGSRQAGEGGSREDSPGPGRRFAPSRLVEPLGSGGQALVWRAVEDIPPHREVALK